MAFRGSYTYVIRADTTAEYQVYLDWLIAYLVANPGAVSYTTSVAQRRITLVCDNAPVNIPVIP